jgi:teichuronic acid biosynthesis glycosyltransferase TuaH
MNNLKIFLLSNEPWGELWFSKHHYANELSKLGYEVYFVNAPKSWKISHLWNRGFKITKYSNNLNIVDYNNIIPLRLFLKLAIFFNDFFLHKVLKKHLNINENDLQWTFDPLRFVFFSLCKRLIFHVADPYMSLSPTKHFHHLLANKALKIICTSPHYETFYRNIGYNNTLLIPHMVSKDEFDIDLDLAYELKSKYGRYILLVGTINSDVDLELLKAVADNNPDENLLIAGSLHIENGIFNSLLTRENVVYLGVINAKLLKDYIYSSEVCITGYYFNLNKGIGSRSPLKLLNYLCQYKPIVTSIDSEIPDLENLAIYKAKDLEDFLNYIKKALCHSLTIDTKAVSTYLNNHQYPNAIQKILNNL